MSDIAYLVEGFTITRVEIQPGSAVGGRMAVRPAGSTGAYRWVSAYQVFDTAQDAQADVERYRQKKQAHGLPVRKGQGANPLLERWGQARANRRRA